MAFIAKPIFTVPTLEEHDYAVSLAARQARTNASPVNVAHREAAKRAAEQVAAGRLFGDLPAKPDNSIPNTPIPVTWCVQYLPAKVARGTKKKLSSGGSAKPTGLISAQQGRNRAVLNYAARGMR
jgi:hypothetical protein